MNTKQLIFYTILGLLVLVSCEEKEKVVYNSSTTVVPELLNPPSQIELDILQKDTPVKFEWSKAEYKLALSFNYQLEIGISGDNFTKPFVLYTGTDLKFETTTDKLNAVIVDELDFKTDTLSKLEVRILSVLNKDTKSSGTVKEINVTPYPTSFPPIFIMGEAFGGLDSANSAMLRNIDPYVYVTTVNFENDKPFRLFSEPKKDAETQYDWSFFTGAVDANLNSAGDADDNLKFIGSAGYYTITVNTIKKDITLEATDEPLMFMTGGALGGWDWSTNYVKMTFVTQDTYTANTDFINKETFRFFAQQDWGPTSFNYPYFDGGNVDKLFENADDGDKNFRFVGETGEFTITVDLLTKKVTMKEKK